MKAKKPTYIDFIRFADSIGFRWHSSGTLKKHGAKFGEYIVGDSITPEQRAALVSKFGAWVSFFVSQSEYAPEQRRPLVCLLSRKAYDEKAGQVWRVNDALAFTA